MTEIIDTALPIYHFSVEAYHKLVDAGILKEDEKVELIEGKIITMSPIKSPHAACVERLGYILQRYFGEKAHVRAQNPIVLGTHSEPEPDLAVVVFKEDFYEEGHPIPKDIFIAIEISQSTEKYDRDIKIPLYAKYGIAESWLVNLNKKEIEVYQEPTKKGYTSVIIYGIKDSLRSNFVDSLDVKRAFKKKNQ